MKNYLDSLLEESEELSVRILKIENCILHLDASPKEIRLLSSQLKHMISYKKVLDKRIKLALSK